MDSRPSRYTWWLDVETMNTWQSGSAEALARNRATLEGMTAYLVSRGGRVGIYSTEPAVGRRSSASVPVDEQPARGPRQLAGRRDVARARPRPTCSDAAARARRRVTLTQYVRDGLDRNHVLPLTA